MTGPGLRRCLPTKPAAGVREVSPRLKKRPSPLPPSLSASLSLSRSLFLIPSFCCPFPGSCSRGPSLPGRRTLLTRQAGPPYPAGGPSLPGKDSIAAVDGADTAQPDGGGGLYDSRGLLDCSPAQVGWWVTGCGLRPGGSKCHFLCCGPAAPPLVITRAPKPLPPCHCHPRRPRRRP